ncbi:MAG: hypothetical protein ACR2QC_06780 [Gammaproteobacteria bacterium]
MRHSGESRNPRRPTKKGDNRRPFFYSALADCATSRVFLATMIYSGGAC